MGDSLASLVPKTPWQSVAPQLNFGLPEVLFCGLILNMYSMCFKGCRFQQEQGIACSCIETKRTLKWEKEIETGNTTLLWSAGWVFKSRLQSLF